jgi:hypothetical protein
MRSCGIYGERCFICLTYHPPRIKCPGKASSLTRYMSGTCCFDCSLPEKDSDYHINPFDKTGLRKCIYSRDAIRRLSMATLQFFPSLIWTTFFKGEVVSFEKYWLWTYQVDNGSQDDWGAGGFLNMVKIFVMIVEKHINDERNKKYNNNNNDDDDDDDDDDDSSDDNNNNNNNKNKHRYNDNNNNINKNNNNNNNKSFNNNSNNNKNNNNNYKYYEENQEQNDFEAPTKQNPKFKELFAPASKRSIISVPKFRGNKDDNNNNNNKKEENDEYDEICNSNVINYNTNNNNNNYNYNNNNNNNKKNQHKTTKKGF